MCTFIAKYQFFVHAILTSSFPVKGLSSLSLPVSTHWVRIAHLPTFRRQSAYHNCLHLPCMVLSFACLSKIELFLLAGVMGNDGDALKYSRLSIRDTLYCCWWVLFLCFFVVWQCRYLFVVRSEVNYSCLCTHSGQGGPTKD